MDKLFYGLGVAICMAGGIIVVTMALSVSLMAVNYYAGRLWKGLLAVHDLRTLRAHMLSLCESGKMKIIKKEDHHG